MRYKIIISTLLMLLIINNSIVNALNIKISDNSIKELNEKDIYYVQLTEKQINNINGFVENITDLQLKNKTGIVLNKIITCDGKLNLKEIQNLSKYYFDVFLNIIFIGKNQTNICALCKENETSNNNFPSGTTYGTSTIFEPPYSSCYSWGKGTNWIDEYAYGCNKYSGAIGACAKAYIGGATAEAMQKLHFYVGRTKTVSINAKIIRSGGTATVGFSAFAGTEKTWSWDDFKKNYNRADVDPWWSWDDIILKIINLVTLLVGFAPKNIIEAIIYLNDIFDFIGFFNQMNDLLNSDNAEIIPISFSFSASPGYHTIWVGLRATVSAFIAGAASAVTMGQVTNITIDGIAAPNSPIITGPVSGKINNKLDFSAQSYDPNSDKIRYFFDWGDGSDSGWSDYLQSGSTVFKSHAYDKMGQYTIKVIVEDIDRMISTSIKELHITNFRTHSINKIFDQFPILTLLLRVINSI